MRGKDGWDMRGNEEDRRGEEREEGRMERREGKKGKGRIDSSREGGRGGQEEERVVNKRMDGVDRRMLGEASGHYISPRGFCQGKPELCVFGRVCVCACVCVCVCVDMVAVN